MGIGRHPAAVRTRARPLPAVGLSGIFIYIFWHTLLSARSHSPGNRGKLSINRYSAGAGVNPVVSGTNPAIAMDLSNLR